MDKRINGKNQLIDAENKKQAFILLENWLKDLEENINYQKLSEDTNRLKK